MTREQGPNFSEKHGADTQIDPAVKRKVEDKTKNNEISCDALCGVCCIIGISGDQ